MEVTSTRGGDRRNRCAGSTQIGWLADVLERESLARLVAERDAAVRPDASPDEQSLSGATIRDGREADNVIVVSDGLRLTIRYSDGGEGWTMAQVEQVPGAISQGRTRAEARENVTDALRLMLRPEPDETADPDREPLELPLAS